MTPYYEQSGITIYHGDCADVIESFGLHWGSKLYDLLLTDPPYGIDYSNAGGFSESSGWGPWRGTAAWDKERPSMAVINQCLALCSHGVIWGGNYFGLPQTSGWLVWDKGQRDFSLADGELAWTTEQRALRIFSYSRAAALKDGKQHPTQKPQALIAWCLSHFPKTRTVFDPFMGSGTTLVEVKRAGLVGVGIEREERYCEIAAKRLAQGALSFEVA